MLKVLTPFLASWTSGTLPPLNQCPPNNASKDDPHSEVSWEEQVRCCVGEQETYGCSDGRATGRKGYHLSVFTQTSVL